MFLVEKKLLWLWNIFLVWPCHNCEIFFARLIVETTLHSPCFAAHHSSILVARRFTYLLPIWDGWSENSWQNIVDHDTGVLLGQSIIHCAPLILATVDLLLSQEQVRFHARSEEALLRSQCGVFCRSATSYFMVLTSVLSDVTVDKSQDFISSRQACFIVRAQEKWIPFRNTTTHIPVA